MSSLRTLFDSDGPDHLEIRKAARAAIVTPAVTAFGIYVVGNDALAVYGTFASFSCLVFADYGGPPRRRAGAYGVAVIGGMLAILFGALLSALPFAAVAGMFALMFGLTFATAWGGYMPLHIAPIALAYSLSALQPLGDLAVAERVTGWALGSLTAMVAALLLWPIRRRIGLHRAAAVLAGDLAVLVGSRRPTGQAEQVEAAKHAVAALEERLASPLRPFGPRSSDIAMVRMIEHIGHSVDLVADVLATGAFDAELRDAIVTALEQTRDLLEGTEPPRAAAHGLEALDAARLAARARLQVNAIGRHLDEIEAAIPSLVLAHVVLWIEYDAARTMGAAFDDLPVLASSPELRDPIGEEVGGLVRRARRQVSWELDPAGVILRNSIRAGVALAAAILLAELLPIDHGFWIVLATMAVLRSGASTTSTTAARAIIGTAGGFVVAAGVVATVGDMPVVLWLLFPVALAVSAWSPGAGHFTVGQGAFAVLVVVLFLLIDLPGLQTDVVRIEAVVLGALSATVLSLVLWPRGARAALAGAAADVARAAAAGARTFVTGSDADRVAAEERLTAARRRSAAVFGAALAEHAEPIDTTAWVALRRPSMLTRSLLVGLVPAVHPSPALCGDALRAVEALAEAAERHLIDVAAQLDDGVAAVAGPVRRLPVPRAELSRCVDASASDVATMRDATILVAWALLIDGLVADLEESAPAVAAVGEGSAPRAWLFGTRSQQPRRSEDLSGTRS